MTTVATFRHEFNRYRLLVEGAVTNLSDDAFFHRPGENANSMALIIKHLAGNLQSRWSEFLTTDGEKPTRNRDGEFVLATDDTRASLIASWQRSWSIVEQTLAGLSDGDLEQTVTIRGEPHTVLQAMLRSINHVAYHTGQILLLARSLRPDAPWLTIPPGKSGEHGQGSYLSAR